MRYLFLILFLFGSAINNGCASRTLILLDASVEESEESEDNADEGANEGDGEGEGGSENESDPS